MSVSSLSGTENSVYSSGSTAGHSGGRAGQSSAGGEITAKKVSADPSGKKELSSDEEAQVSKLRQRDREVRAHEAAHIGAGGGVVRGGATYSYQAGPDGKRYAVGGEVGIDASAVKDNPQATIIKMQRVRAAALAPANPSGTDRSVAASASATEAAARMEVNKEKSSGNISAAAPSEAGSKPAEKKMYDENGTKKGPPASLSVDLFA